jgi:hypothetical protein
MLQQLSLNQLDEDMKQCIQDCFDCHSICLNTVNYWALLNCGMNWPPKSPKLGDFQPP